MLAPLEPGQRLGVHAQPLGDLGLGQPERLPSGSQVPAQPGRQFPAYVRKIEMVTTKAKERMASVELANEAFRAPNGGLPIPMNSSGADIACVVPPKDAAKLDVGKAFDVKGKVLTTTSRVEQTPLGLRQIITVVASCTFATR